MAIFLVLNQGIDSHFPHTENCFACMMLWISFQREVPFKNTCSIMYGDWRVDVLSENPHLPCGMHLPFRVTVFWPTGEIVKQVVSHLAKRSHSSSTWQRLPTWPYSLNRSSVALWRGSVVGVVRFHFDARLRETSNIYPSAGRDSHWILTRCGLKLL